MSHFEFYWQIRWLFGFSLVQIHFYELWFWKNENCAMLHNVADVMQWLFMRKTRANVCCDWIYLQMSDAVASAKGSLPRPVLKGRHLAWMKKHLAIGIGMSFVSVVLTKIFVNDVRKAAYAEYYKWVSPNWK